MSPIRIALVGIGKIARDQHAPTINADTRFSLAGAVSLHDGLAGLPCWRSISKMAASDASISAVAICTPPRGRLALVTEALEHGLHVMIEKPPAATLMEAEAFATLAARHGRTLFATWHSREAAGVEPAKAWLATRRVRNAAVTWKEDVRIWHPGQAWIWEPGIGVFDPGINAISLLTAILPGDLQLEAAELRFPANRAAPIAADLQYRYRGEAPVSVAFDFDQRGPQTWDIQIETDDGKLKLSCGASRLFLDDVEVAVGDEPEYARLYRRFADLIAARRSDIDLTPFRHVADAFLRAERKTVAPFEE